MRGSAISDNLLWRHSFEKYEMWHISFLKHEKRYYLKLFLLESKNILPTVFSCAHTFLLHRLTFEITINLAFILFAFSMPLETAFSWYFYWKYFWLIVFVSLATGCMHGEGVEVEDEKGQLNRLEQGPGGECIKAKHTWYFPKPPNVWIPSQLK